MVLLVLGVMGVVVVEHRVDDPDDLALRRAPVLGSVALSGELCADDADNDTDHIPAAAVVTGCDSSQSASRVQGPRCSRSCLAASSTVSEPSSRPSVIPSSQAYPSSAACSLTAMTSRPSSS
jgi:hypothetical protein